MGAAVPASLQSIADLIEEPEESKSEFRLEQPEPGSERKKAPKL